MTPSNNIKPLIQGATAFIAVSTICTAVAHNAGRIYKVIETANHLGAPVLLATAGGSIVLGASVDAATRYLLSKIFRVTNPIILQIAGTITALLTNATVTILLTSYKIIHLATPPGGLLLMLGAGAFLVYKFFNLTDVLDRETPHKSISSTVVTPNSDPAKKTPGDDEMSMYEKKQVLRELVIKTPHVVFGAPVHAFLKPFFKDENINVFEDLKKEWNTIIPKILDRIKIDVKHKQVSLNKVIETEYDKFMDEVNGNPFFGLLMNAFLHGNPAHCRWILEELLPLITKELERLSIEDSNKPANINSQSFLLEHIRTEADEILRLNQNYNSPSRLRPPKKGKWQSWNLSLSKEKRERIAKEWNSYELQLKYENAYKESKLPFYCKYLSTKYFLPANLIFNEGVNVFEWLFKTQFLESALLWGLKKFKNYCSKSDGVDTSNNSQDIELVEEHLPFVMKLIETLAPSIRDLYDWKYYINHFRIRKQLIESSTPPDKNETSKILLEFYQHLIEDILEKGNIADAIDSSLVAINRLIVENHTQEAVV